jgi:AcrR family transcriptional regulator
MTTRQLAVAAGIGVGTFFNYFPTKEALLLTLIADALRDAVDEYRRRRRGAEDLVEDLFLLVSTGLRALVPFRAHVAAVLQELLGPLGSGAARDDLAARIRAMHLEQVAEIFRAHGVDPDSSFVTLHLYWSLFVGVLSFWARDASPHQEDTLVLLDRSLQLLVTSVAPTLAAREQIVRSEVDDDVEH